MLCTHFRPLAGSCLATPCSFDAKVLAEPRIAFRPASLVRIWRHRRVLSGGRRSDSCLVDNGKSSLLNELETGLTPGAEALPFQGWRRFKEAFAPELVEQAVVETQAALGRPLRSALDPFGGSGTSALAAQFLGVRPTTIEVNPFLSDLIEAKIGRYDLDKAGVVFGQVVERASQLKPAAPLFPGAPATFVESGVDGRFIFSQAVACRLASYRDAIAMVDDVAIRGLFKVLLAAAAIPVSNVVVSGKGRR